MASGNEYEGAPTYVVPPDEGRPPIGHEGVSVVDVGSSGDSSEET